MTVCISNLYICNIVCAIKKHILCLCNVFHHVFKIKIYDAKKTPTNIYSHPVFIIL